MLASVIAAPLDAVAIYLILFVLPQYTPVSGAGDGGFAGALALLAFVAIVVVSAVGMLIRLVMSVTVCLLAAWFGIEYRGGD